MKISVTSPSFSKNEILVKELKNSFDNVKLNTKGIRFDKEQLIEYLKDSDGVIVGLEKIDKEVLDNLPKLKYISKYGVGLNNIDLDECKKRGIKIGWKGGVNKVSVAEMTLGYMLMLMRNLFVSSNRLKKGIWEKNGGFQLTGKTIGIIGVGYIGKEVVRLLKPFNCLILVNDIINQDKYYKENNLIETSKEEIYKKADIITIHTPLDKTTENLITLKEFQMMKNSAYVINSARGGIINEDDLKYALQNNLITGAAIDAYIQEPPSDMELLSLENLICTPHIAGNAYEAVLAMGKSAIENLKFIIKNGESLI